jgi:hypothetical protein
MVVMWHVPSSASKIFAMVQLETAYSSLALTCKKDTTGSQWYDASPDGIQRVTAS